MSGVAFARETFATVHEDIRELLVDHWREVANNQDRVFLEPDWERYQKLEQAGFLVILTVRRAERLVGYSIFFLTHHIHYKSHRVATNDVLFLSPTERKAGIGLTLLRYAETVLKPLADHIVYHSKPAHDISPILRRLGYEQEEIIMGKLL